MTRDEAMDLAREIEKIIRADTDCRGRGILNSATVVQQAFAKWEGEMRGALSRQCGNMAFALNNMHVPERWYEKFRSELKEDRQALTAKGDSRG